MDQKQKERQQRGDDFQDEIRRSWTLVKSWRMRIPDGKGGSRPADELVLLEAVNLLIEMKRTEGDRFELSFLRPSQVNGLLAFDKVFEQNYGLVLVSFLNEATGVDEAYAFQLIGAVKFMQQRGRKFISLDEFREAAAGRTRPFKAHKLPKIYVDEYPGYDLRGLSLCYKYI